MVSQTPREVVNLFLGNVKEEMAGEGAALTDKLEPRASAAQLTAEQSVCCMKMYQTPFCAYPFL